MKYGLFWGISLVVGYILTYFSFGMFLVWKASQSYDSSQDFLFMILSFVAHVILGGFLLPGVIVLAIWMFWKDKAKWDTLKKFIPIFSAYLYSLLPFNIPGFLDELILLGIASVLNFFWIKLQRSPESENPSSK